MASLDIVPLEEPVDHHYGEIRVELSRQGQPIGQNNLFIAAQARALGVVLVTTNIGEFARVRPEGGELADERPAPRLPFARRRGKLAKILKKIYG